MVNRAADAAEPDDTSHVRGLEGAGAMVVRGTGRITAPGVVAATADGGSRELLARHVVVAVGSTSKVAPVEGVAATNPWTNREATLARELPTSLLVLGGGPTGSASWPRSTRASAYRSPSSSRGPGSPDRAPAQRRERSGSRWSVTASACAPACAPYGLVRAPVPAASTSSTSTTAPPPRGTPSSWPSGESSPSRNSGWSSTASPSRVPARTGGTARCGWPTDCGSRVTRQGRSSTRTQAHYQGELVVRMALGEDVVPDYARCPGPPTWTPRPRRSG